MSDETSTMIPKATQEDIDAWWRAKQELDRWKGIEALARRRIFNDFFPAAVEGTNTHILENGWQLKGNRVINRDVDAGALSVLRQPVEVDGVRQNYNWFEKYSINADKVFRYKPELVLSEYRNLTAEQMMVVDQCLTIKDGMPGLDVKPPSTRKPKNAA